MSVYVVDTGESDGVEPAMRKRTVITLCANHLYLTTDRYRLAEIFCEGGPARGPCTEGKPCRIRPGSDFFAAGTTDEIADGWVRDWAVNTKPAFLVNRDVTAGADYSTEELCYRCGGTLGTEAVAVETRKGGEFVSVEFVCGTCEKSSAFRLQPE